MIEALQFFQTDISQFRMNVEIVVVHLNPLANSLLRLFQTGKLVEPDDLLFDCPERLLCP
jgi:hypothetical protein